jgi:hypothetical protein
MRIYLGNIPGLPISSITASFFDIPPECQPISSIHCMAVSDTGALFSFGGIFELGTNIDPVQSLEFLSCVFSN